MDYRLAYPSRSLRRFLKSGLPVRAACDQACDLRLNLRMNAAAAKKIGIRRRPDSSGLVLIGLTENRRHSPAGSLTVRGKAFRQAIRRLSRVRRAKVQIVSTVLDSYGWRRAVERRWLTLTSKKPLRRR